MKPDILVYIRAGENDELRYSIRSWQKNLSFNKLCVVGGPKPDWLIPDIYIENTTKLQKMEQCYDNLIKALKYHDISEDLLIIMDDVFVMRKYDDWAINYNRGTLSEHINRSTTNGVTTYDEQLVSTNTKLLSEGFDSPLSFEEHAPFRCNKSKLLKVLESFSQSDIQNILWRSVYGNRNHIKTEFKLDYKIQSIQTSFDNFAPVISTNDTVFRQKIRSIMQDRFPQKSRFEK